MNLPEQTNELLFPEGMPGFPQLRQFQIVQEEQGIPFYTLQSLEEENVAFWVLDPFAFFQDYEFTLSETAKAQLEIEDGTQIGVCTIVTSRPEGQVTVNLKAPIVVNINKGLARQVILNDERYNIRQPLFPQRMKVSSE
ncbi:flagellar assembly protein FliW [Brevibacillus borstelensis]|uniref:flagellar assembly protein FliW n=1 Tax=Brevibacillus borstelensis TaxID=45462 RepID=UPI00149066C1|nr:flagellar assembly protein FliW [Brevibacillus borstelensis]MCM3471000.1 flagellar assembly protein FliW [Brevibacillus borstelensis]NOU58030.1 flagellar assembly protein FliW [Brevibacillus borstelensis]